MLILTQNSDNIICVTATEITNNINYDFTGTTGYTIDIYDDLTKSSFTGITLHDSSFYKSRYNLFNLILTGKSDEDYSLSKVHLPKDGFYFYKIYFEIDGTRILAEQGIIKVENEKKDSIYEYKKINKYYSYKKE